MDKIENNIAQIKDFILKNTENNDPGHGVWHSIRVWENAKIISKNYDVNLEIIGFASLLHDVGDWKFSDPDESSVNSIHQLLNSLSIAHEKISLILHIIQNISFRIEDIDRPELPLEGKIVNDADRLEAIGAIGIARVFTFHGYKNTSLIDDQPPRSFKNTEDYRTHISTAINHFYEKLFKIQDSMYTLEGKAMAKERHKYMLSFLSRFYDEMSIPYPEWHKILMADNI